MSRRRVLSSLSLGMRAEIGSRPPAASRELPRAQRRPPEQGQARSSPCQGAPFQRPQCQCARAQAAPAVAQSAQGCVKAFPAYVSPAHTPAYTRALAHAQRTGTRAPRRAHAHAPPHVCTARASMSARHAHPRARTRFPHTARARASARARARARPRIRIRGGSRGTPIHKHNSAHARARARARARIPACFPLLAPQRWHRARRLRRPAARGMPGACVDNTECSEKQMHLHFPEHSVCLHLPR